MRLIWATRGRAWGFRFLLDGGYVDPLPPYERAFAGTDGDSTVCRRVGGWVALRFPDPVGRCDDARRVIPHEVVVLPPQSSAIGSLDDGLRLIWPQLADGYARLWDRPQAPTPADVAAALGADVRQDG